jgi:hypothetical protein
MGGVRIHKLRHRPRSRIGWNGHALRRTTAKPSATRLGFSRFEGARGRPARARRLLVAASGELRHQFGGKRGFGLARLGLRSQLSDDESNRIGDDARDAIERQAVKIVHRPGSVRAREAEQHGGRIRRGLGWRANGFYGIADRFEAPRAPFLADLPPDRAVAGRKHASERREQRILMNIVEVAREIVGARSDNHAVGVKVAIEITCRSAAFGA